MLRKILCVLLVVSLMAGCSEKEDVPAAVSSTSEAAPSIVEAVSSHIETPAPPEASAESVSEPETAASDTELSWQYSSEDLLDVTLVGPLVMKDENGDEVAAPLNAYSFNDNFAQFWLDEGRRGVFFCHIDYNSEYLVIFDKENMTVEPIMDLNAAFESWRDYFKVVTGADDRLFICSRNKFYSYDLETQTLRDNVLNINHNGETPFGLGIVGFAYDAQAGQFLVGYTPRTGAYSDEQNGYLWFSVLDKEGKQIANYQTQTCVMQDFFLSWSTKLIEFTDNKVVFYAFPASFSVYLEDAKKKDTGIEGAPEKFVKLADENYKEYSFDLETGVLTEIASVDTREIGWKVFYRVKG